MTFSPDTCFAAFTNCTSGMTDFPKKRFGGYQTLSLPPWESLTLCHSFNSQPRLDSFCPPTFHFRRRDGRLRQWLYINLSANPNAVAVRSLDGANKIPTHHQFGWHSFTGYPNQRRVGAGSSAQHLGTNYRS